MTSGQGDLRILLLGKTGAGRSATGNTILGRNAFKESETCEKQEGDLDGKNIAVIDTPGLFNTSITKEQVKAEIERCVEMSAPGPHVFLLVIKLGVRFTQEERNSVQWIQENFGEEASLRTIILFTHTDHLKGKSLEAYITESHYLQKIFHSCGGRYHSFNNEDRNNQQQVKKLLQKINALRREEGMKHYTPEMFKTTQTEMTGKDRMKLLNLTNVLSIIILMGVIFLATLQWKNRLQKEEHKLKNDILLIEQDIEQLKKKLLENEPREQLLKADLQQKEQEEQQLGNELLLKEQEEQQLTDELQEKEQDEKQLRNDLLLKEREKQLKQELLENEQREQLLKADLQQMEQEEQQLRNELLLKEQEEQQPTDELQEKDQGEKQLRNELLQKEENEQDLKNQLQKKKWEKLQLKEELLQKEQKMSVLLQQKKQEILKLKEELLQKEQKRSVFLQQKKQEILKLKEELLQKEKEECHLNEKLLQKEQEKEKLKKDLQQKQQENQKLKNDLRQKLNQKQKLEKKLLQYTERVQ